MKNEHTEWERLAQYFAGELTEQEEQKMKSWIKADPEREQRVHQLRKIWKESGILPYQLDIDKAWNHLSDSIDKLEQGKAVGLDHTGRSATGKQSSLQPGRLIRRVAITAAAAAVLIFAGLFSYYNFNSNEQADVAIEQLVAQQGERTTYVLSDGSRVILHAGSRLDVPIRFTEDTRELYLEGEAYFEVARDTERPFIVRSEKSYTRVLGTKFLVKAWPELQEIEVVVAEGKVAFGSNRPAGISDKDEAIVTQNQKGLLTGNKIPEVTDVTSLNWYLGWTQGRLVFDNRPLSEIIPKLERWYALDIQVEDEAIESQKLSAEIDYSQPMMEVLKGIALSLDLELIRENRTVTFHLQERDQQ